MNEFHEQFDWRRLLRERRLRLRVSLPELGRRAGLSLSAVKAYEAGERHPSREALAAIIEALGIPVEEANRILAGAGYAIDMRNILTEKYAPRPLDWFSEEVEHYVWPVFVTNQSSDILSANRAFRLLVGIPLNQRLQDQKWSFIARASDPAFAGRLENWGEAMAFMIGLGKAEQRWDVNAERPPPPTRDAYRQLLEGDPAYITRMLRLWESAEPVAHTTRMHYRAHWRLAPDQLLRFECTMHPADIWQELSWHDWIPADQETLRAVRGL